MQSLIILTPSLLPAWPCGPSNPAQLQRRCLTGSRIRPELHIDPRPSHATAPHRPQPDLNLAPQSSPLEAAVKSEPAFDAESCGAKSTVPPKRGFVKAVTLLHYSRSAHSQVANALHRAHLRSCAHAGLMRMQCRSTAHMRRLTAYVHRGSWRPRSKGPRR